MSGHFDTELGGLTSRILQSVVEICDGFSPFF